MFAYEEGSICFECSRYKKCKKAIKGTVMDSFFCSLFICAIYEREYNE